MIIEVKLFEGQDLPRPKCDFSGCKKQGRYVIKINLFGASGGIVRSVCGAHAVELLKPEIRLELEPQMVHLVKSKTEHYP